jgi:hypothetical protein
MPDRIDASAPRSAARATALLRRAPLLARMQELQSRGVGCAACTTSACCTFVANSMRVTPLEAVDLYDALVAGGRMGPELEAALAATVQRFGLDRPAPGDGRRSFGRRRYTCPFLRDGSLGCTLPAAAKPYGCLAYNARRAGVADGEDCGSEQALLDAARAAAVATDLDDRLRAELGLAWETATIPEALLDLAAAHRRRPAIPIR